MYIVGIEDIPLFLVHEEIRPINRYLGIFSSNLTLPPNMHAISDSYN